MIYSITIVSHLAIMETETLQRRQTSFRLREDLLNRIKKEADKENRSLNNYVESLLMDAIYRKPNTTTLEALREAQSGKNLETIDLDNFEKFVSSL